MPGRMFLFSFLTSITSTFFLDLIDLIKSSPLIAIVPITNLSESKAFLTVCLNIFEKHYSKTATYYFVMECLGNLIDRHPNMSVFMDRTDIPEARKIQYRTMVLQRLYNVGFEWLKQKGKSVPSV